MGMVASPSSSLNTPVGASVASPGGEEAAYREKVRQLSKYIEPLRRMVMRMVNEGESEFYNNRLLNAGKSIKCKVIECAAAFVSFSLTIFLTEAVNAKFAGLNKVENTLKNSYIRLRAFKF